MEQNDLQKCLDIKPGQLWLCRDRGMARIYTNDGAPPFVIHGAIDHSARLWMVASWTSGGSFGHSGDGPHDLIRRYDWREELAPIWAVLKPEYRWVGRAAPGYWMAYTRGERPLQDKAAFWGAGESYKLHALLMPTPDCPWYETLTERPDK